MPVLFFRIMFWVYILFSENANSFYKGQTSNLTERVSRHNNRMEKAAELLIISDKRISVIAHDCLFGDTAHFSSAFKIKYQLSPSDYRLSQSQK